MFSSSERNASWPVFQSDAKVYQYLLVAHFTNADIHNQRAQDGRMSRISAEDKSDSGNALAFAGAPSGFDPPILNILSSCLILIVCQNARPADVLRE